MSRLSFVLSGLLFFATFAFVCGSTAIAQAPLHSPRRTELKTIHLKITGMTCASCNSHVATTLKAVEGVIDQKVKYPGDVATITFNPNKISAAVIIKVIEKLGYTATTIVDKSVIKQS